MAAIDSTIDQSIGVDCVPQISTVIEYVWNTKFQYEESPLLRAEDHSFMTILRFGHFYSAQRFYCHCFVSQYRSRS